MFLNILPNFDEEFFEDLQKTVANTPHLSCRDYLLPFLREIDESANKPMISTGFHKLDAALDGGLYPGLYGIGAISSLGKTTLFHQVADQVAKQGYDVLFFSLEMSRSELMAKSISRETFSGSETSISSKSIYDIIIGGRHKDYSEEEQELIMESISKYYRYADKIFIIEGMGDISAKKVREAVENHVQATGKAPVVIIDYLQILQAENDRATDKQNTDRAVLKLKHISRDFKTPVIAISSFNRDNYNNEVTMQAFKESGAIEYSCDVLFGLQFKGIGQSNFDINKAKQANPRNVELVILKNRNGETGVKTEFSYYPKYNFFEER